MTKEKKKKRKVQKKKKKGRRGVDGEMQYKRQKDEYLFVSQSS